MLIIILVAVLGVAFPIFLVNAIRAQEFERSETNKGAAALCFGLLMTLLALLSAS